MRKYQKSEFILFYFGWRLRAISNSDIFEDDLKNGHNLKNTDDLNNKEVLKIEDYLRNEGDLKNKDSLKNEDSFTTCNTEPTKIQNSCQGTPKCPMGSVSGQC